jgi:hypothetical protein
MKHLHQLVKTQLGAPALAWTILSFYWGMSAFGLGPAYKDYMQSSEVAIDLAWTDSELNRIAGLERSLTIKERFDRAVNFYLYCFEQGRSNSINPPFDMPPTTNDLMQLRLRSGSITSKPDALIEASNSAVLGDKPELLGMWAIGGKETRERRSKAYNDRVAETLKYVASEITSLTTVTKDQLSDHGFLVEGFRGERYNVTADLMDEVMSEEVQNTKFGECYIQPSSREPPKMVLSGIFGAYYTAGHNLELAMFDEDSKTRLSSIYHAILHTWRQLYDISKENK